jgi:hypothetical protein
MSKLYPRKDIPAFLARQPINPIREPKLHRNVVVPPLDPDKIEASAEKVDDDWYGNLANGRLDKHTRAQVLAVVVVVVVVVVGGVRMCSAVKYRPGFVNLLLVIESIAALGWDAL